MSEDKAGWWACAEVGCDYNSPSIPEMTAHGEIRHHVGIVDSEYAALISIRAGAR